MRNLKNTLIALLSLAMILSCAALAACASKEEPPTPASSSTDTGPAEKKAVLKMATNAYFQPYEYYDGDRIVGIDAEIAAEIAKKLGRTLEIQDMKFDSIITAVKTGAADFGMAAMTVTEDREKEVAFTISYAGGVQSVIVKEGSPIQTADDLSADGATYKIGVQLGTTGHIYATDDFGNERVVTYATPNEAVLSLSTGDVDCVIVDNEPAKSLVKANAGLKILDTSYADEDYAICVDKGNKDLKQQIDKAIRELNQEGKIDEIIDRYIPH